MQANSFAVLTVICMTALTLALRATLQIWPVGLAGTCSRVVTLTLLGSWVLASNGGWRRLLLRDIGVWLALTERLVVGHPPWLDRGRLAAAVLCGATPNDRLEASHVDADRARAGCPGGLAILGDMSKRPTEPRCGHGDGGVGGVDVCRTI